MTTLNKTISFIGAGNMARSIIGGMLNSGWQPSQIMATAPSESTCSAVSREFGIKVSDNNHEAVSSDVIFLCVKPHLMQSVLADLAPDLLAHKPLLISVAAGVTMDCLCHWAGGTSLAEGSSLAESSPLADGSLAIIRSMPNTPSLLGVGACGLYANSLVTDGQKELAESIFQSVGIAEWVDQEELINAVIAVSGSGPAYYFLFMEAMKNVGERLGLTPEVAERLTLQTALGAANMAAQSGSDIAQLRKNVCSPGGTTEQAVRTLQEGGLDNILEQAMENAVKRAKEMADELSK